MKILVYGALPRHANLGVAALACGSRAILERAFPGADIRFRSAGPEGDGPINLTHTTPFLKETVVNRRGLRAWTRSFDLVCDIRGGDSFTDIYTTKSLFKLSLFPLYARILGRRIVLLPQTIGPFEHRRSRLLARAYLRVATIVMSRDPRSAAFAKVLGREVDLVGTDVVFAIAQPSDVQPGDHDVIVNVSGLLWTPNRHVDADAYRAATRAIIDSLLEGGRRVTLLAHVVGATESGPDNDRAAIAELRAMYGDRVTYVSPDSLDEVRRVIASASVLVGARMHACLNALSVGVPAIPLAYSRKFAPLLEDLDWPYTVDLRASADEIATAVLDWIQTLRPQDVEPVLTTARTRIDQVVSALAALPR
ncbi:polysaccharide pyruvyl transferase family protein [Micrococcus luteus]|uniref:polysaccharide pyruvyl transferase family protein n=1 Tax=Micrococcus luteus TaxID=1270 RepID=UPI003412DBA7|nr:polysaccharide pyruvyl transferase family protein [Micrococcus luteus]